MILFGGAAFAAETPSKTAPVAPRLPVWEIKLKDYSDADYRYAVEQLFQDFEHRTGRALVPGVKKKVGLKIHRLRPRP